MEKKLSDFGVEVKVVAAYPGPVVTRYEIEPATGVKGSQVVNLARDLARSLSPGFHPGGGNHSRQESAWGWNCPIPSARRCGCPRSSARRSINESASNLTHGAGQGHRAASPMVADLAKMPHCMVAGTTGSGKSVGHQRHDPVAAVQSRGRRRCG
ncbi:DNA translocase FtsK [Cupriavidus basilensis]